MVAIPASRSTFISGRRYCVCVATVQIDSGWNVLGADDAFLWTTNPLGPNCFRLTSAGGVIPVG